VGRGRGQGQEDISERARARQGRRNRPPSPPNPPSRAQRRTGSGKTEGRSVPWDAGERGGFAYRGPGCATVKGNQTRAAAAGGAGHPKSPTSNAPAVPCVGGQCCDGTEEEWKHAHVHRLHIAQQSVQKTPTHSQESTSSSTRQLAARC
jgi:hypothetical protein